MESSGRLPTHLTCVCIALPFIRSLATGRKNELNPQPPTLTYFRIPELSRRARICGESPYLVNSKITFSLCTSGWTVAEWPCQGTAGAKLCETSPQLESMPALTTLQTVGVRVLRVQYYGLPLLFCASRSLNSRVHELYTKNGK